MENEEKQTIILPVDGFETAFFLNGQPVDNEMLKSLDNRTYRLYCDIYPAKAPSAKENHNFETCEDCQKRIAQLAKIFLEHPDINERIEFFLSVCQRSAAPRPEFKTQNFLEAAKMAAKKVRYTEQCIADHHDTENWYKAITDYIDVVIKYFWQMPSGYIDKIFLTSYIYSVCDSVEKYGDEVIGKDKKNILLEYLNQCKDMFKQMNITFMPQLPTLFIIYQEWLNSFPFELHAYFGHLKDYFINVTPFFCGYEINMYSGDKTGIHHTPESLIETIENITNELLSKITGAILYDKGLITDVRKARIDIIVKGTILRDKLGYSNGSKDEKLPYVKILEDWFERQKVFFAEIVEAITDSKPQQALPQPPQGKMSNEIPKEQLSNYGFFQLEKVQRISERDKIKLIDKIFEKGGLPFAIAMFDYLGFLSHLNKKHFPTGYTLNKEIGKWFDMGERTVKGNISSLSYNTTEDKNRYTAHKHKESVISYYEALK